MSQFSDNYNASPDFGQITESQGSSNTQSLYHAVTNIYEFPQYLKPAFTFIERLLTKMNVSIVDELPSSSELNYLATLDHLASEASAEITCLPKTNLSELEVQEAYTRQYAPFSLMPAAWLKKATRLVYAEKESGVLIQEIAKKWQSITYGPTPEGLDMRTEFQQAIDAVVECNDPSFVCNYQVTPHSLEHALSGICLGLFPGSFMPEIVGYNFWQANVGLYTLLSDKNRITVHHEMSQELKNQSAKLVELFMLEAGPRASALYPRVIKGFTLAQKNHLQWRKALYYQLSNTSPQMKMYQLLTAKARYAKGFHKGIQVSGKPLDQYFAEGPNGCADLLRKLRATPYINSRCPHHSALIKQSTSLKGKMFGIFNTEELATIQSWIEQSNDSDDVTGLNISAPSLMGDYTAPVDVESFQEASDKYFSSKTISELTFYLANSDRYPIVIPNLVRCAEFSIKSLNKSAALTCPEPDIPPYSLRAVEMMIERNRQLHMKKFEIDNEPHLKGQDLINKHANSFSAYCTDGCWLDGTMQPEKMHKEEYRILFDIYRDENGAGDFSANHNIIARKLLNSMGYQFPSINQPEFYTTGNSQSSFITPFIQFSLSTDTVRYLPEILGINLTLETNGIGWKYRRDSAELKADGYDPLYMDVHVTIDNFASGHGYMAKRAIISYLESAKQFGTEHQKRMWERVFCAYTGMTNLFDRATNPDIRQIYIELHNFTIEQMLKANEQTKPSVV